LLLLIIDLLGVQAAGCFVSDQKPMKEGMGFDPHSGQKKSGAIFSVHLNRQDCSGGPEL
jgi:hypothetical protein